jgi:hypothetical protein
MRIAKAGSIVPADHIRPPVLRREMQRQLVAAYFSFYARVKQAFSNVPYFAKVLPSSFNVPGRRLAAVCRLMFVTVTFSLFKRLIRG